jgi:hypothetical protein
MIIRLLYLSSKKDVRVFEEILDFLFRFGEGYSEERVLRI